MSNHTRLEALSRAYVAYRDTGATIMTPETRAIRGRRNVAAAELPTTADDSNTIKALAVLATIIPDMPPCDFLALEELSPRLLAWAREQEHACLEGGLSCRCVAVREFIWTALLREAVPA